MIEVMRGVEDEIWLEWCVDCVAWSTCSSSPSENTEDVGCLLEIVASECFKVDFDESG